MRLLADESRDFAVVRALRLDGHDVFAVGEMFSRSIDRELTELAKADERILLTEDKDFGWLVFAAHLESPGVVLIRFPAGARQSLAESIRRLVGCHGADLARSFTTLQPGSVRIRRGK